MMKVKFLLMGVTVLLCSIISFAQVNPVQPANGFNAFVQQNATLTTNESEGPIAIGGNLTVGGNYQVNNQSIAALSVSNVPIGLLVGGTLNLSAGSLQINGNSYVKIGNCASSNIKVWYVDNNNAASNLYITGSSASYSATPNININAHNDSWGTPVLSAANNPVCDANTSSLINFTSAFNTMKSYATNLATLSTSGNILSNPNGNVQGATVSSVLTGGQLKITLANGTNILNVTGSDLNSVTNGITFTNSPSASRILIINVNAPGSFSWNVWNQGGIGGNNSPYILYNFYNTTSLDIAGNNTIEGTVFAPYADINKTTNQSNIEGQVIGQSFVHSGGELHYYPFNASINGCTNSVASITGSNSVCAGSTTTLSNTTAGGTWSSSDNTTATISAGGVVSGIKAGTVTITYSVSGYSPSATMTFTVKAISTSNTNIRICSSALPYTWNGLTFNAAGTQTAHLTNTVGCDSAATLNLTIGSPSGIVLSQTAATCNTLNNPNYNGAISITSGTNANRVGISSLNAASYNGARYYQAATISSLPFTIKSNVPNTGGTYIVRVYGLDSTCYSDINVTVAEVLCAVSCPNSVFPTGSNIASLTWVIPPSNSVVMSNFYLPSSASANSAYTIYAPGNLTIQNQNLTNYTAFCSDISKTLYINSSYTNYRVVPLEFLAKEEAGISGTAEVQIPDGGIGPVRAGMVRYLVDKHFTSTNSTNSSWTTNNKGIAFQIALWEITHDQYNTGSINFTVKSANTNGLYFDYSSNSATNKAIIDSAELWVKDIQNQTWDWTAYNSTVWHAVAVNSPTSQDLLVAEPISVCPTCTKPNAGSDQNICLGNSGSVTATLTGTNTANGTWTALGSNPSGASLGSTSSGVATATFTAIGTYSFVYTVSGGCSDTLNIVVKRTSTSTTNANICAGSAYTFNGTSYSSAGTYVYNTTNAVGCDSAATLVLTIKANSTSTTNASICAGSSYTFNGTSYSASGTYVYHTTNAVGCDSAATLVLTVKANSTSTTNSSICDGSAYTFNGTSYSAAGSYVYHTTNAVGCDSAATLILTVKANSTSTTNASICDGSSYTFNGTSYSVAGTYVYHTTNVVGCDSAATLVLTLKANSTSTTNANICAGSSYTFNGTSYNTAGSYVYHTNNAVGCDSAATLVLTVKANSTSTTNANICDGSSYTFNGSTYSAAGSYVYHTTNAVGCDSAATLVLAVNANSTSTTNASICAGSSYTFNGTSYSAAGTYVYHTTNAVGCDSAATLVLTVKANSTSTTNANICAGSSYTFNGTSYNTAGTYIYHTTNAVGCDSAATLVLTVKANSTSTTNASICAGSSYTFNGTSYSTAGTYVYHTTNAVGCDSAATLVLTNSTSSSTLIDSFYAGTTYTFNGFNFTTAGTYQYHTTNAVGCDSSVTLILNLAVDTSSVSGGSGGGLESKPLGNAISQRFYNMVSNSMTEKTNYTNIPDLIKLPTVSVSGNSVSLQSILPSGASVANILGGNISVYPTTPTDLVNMTNALEVQALDYTKNTTCKAVAFATKTSGMIYSHTKPVCDRLREAELQDVQSVKIGTVSFVQYKLQQHDGKTEYAISFSVGKNMNSNFYEIQSKWLTEDYTGLDTMYNFQIWGVNPQVVKSMVNDVLNNLNASLPYYQLSYTAVPQTYIMSHRRNQTAMEITINNNTSATTANLMVTEYMNELTNALPAKIIPVTINPNGKTIVSFDMADKYQADIKMYDNTVAVVNDEIYSNDGPWDISYNKNTTAIQQFNIANDGLVPATDEFRLFRNVSVKASTSDYVTIFKTMKAAALPRDINAYNGLKFTANANGANALRITFVKNSITDWGAQYSVTIPAKQGIQDYSINYADLVSAGAGNIDASDVTAISFSFIVSNSNTALNASISNARLIKSTVIVPPTSDSKWNIYPNPVVNNSFTCKFNALKAETLTLKIIEVGTGKVLQTETINSSIGSNQVMVTLNKAIGSTKNYVVTLQGDYTKYDLQNIVIMKK